MTDSELERLVAETLDVQPAGEFVARVRARVATERPRRRLSPLFFVCAGASIALVLTVWIGGGPMAGVAGGSGARVQAEPVAAAALNPAAGEPGEVAGKQAGRGTAVDAPVAEATRQPGARLTLPLRAKTVGRPLAAEVLVPEDERAGLRLLLQRVSEGEFVAPVTQEDVAAPESFEAPPIRIEAIAVSPIWAEAEGEAQ